MRDLIAAVVVGTAVGVVLGGRWTPRAAEARSHLPSAACAAEAARTCDGLARALEACEAERDRRAAAPASRLAWPDLAPAVDWTAVFARCDIPGELVDARCDQAPCLASFVRDPEVTDAELEAAFEACPLVPEVGDGGEGVGVDPWTVTCPDGSEAQMDVVGFAPELDRAGRALSPEDDDLTASLYGAGVFGLRAGELARRWPCR